MKIDTIKQLFDHVKWQECIELCIKAIKNKYENAEIWSLCALSYGNMGRNNDAIECLEEALKIDKKYGGLNNFNISLNLAEFYRRNNMTLKAISLLKSLLPRDDENLHFNLAKCYGDMQDYEKSIQHYTIAIKLNPKDIHAIFNLANQQAAMGSFKLALKYYALAYEGGMGDAGINLAQIYTSLDNLKPALAIYNELESYYMQDSNFYFNYANTLRYNLDFDFSRQAYNKAISIKNDVKYIMNLSHLLLSLDELEDGFLLYEHRKALLSNNMPKHFLDYSFDSREELLIFLKDKKVALYHEQGFGDSIMFARFLPLLECKEKILFVPKELCNLFACFNIPCSNEIHYDYDIALPLPSLAFIFAKTNFMKEILINFRTILQKFLYKNNDNNTKIKSYINNKIFNDANLHYEIDVNDLDTNIQNNMKEYKIPINKILQSYEIGDKDSKEFLTKHKNDIFNNKYLNNNNCITNDKKIKIAINFSSNPNFQNAREKSIYAHKLLESIPKDKFIYFSLQYEGIDKDIANEFNVIDMSSHINNFEDTANILMCMDFVISIDSALAHLSATLGIPTAILLYKRHDWRWGRLGEHNSTIWYDNVFLFKQKELHEWGNVLKKLNIFLSHKDFNNIIKGE